MSDADRRAVTGEEHDVVAEALLNLMRANSIATGHGDTLLELIATINDAVVELRAKYIACRVSEAAAAAELEAALEQTDRADPSTDKAEAALVIAREALRQIARDREAARPTAFYVAKARFALDRIEVLMQAEAADAG